MGQCYRRSLCAECSDSGEFTVAVIIGVAMVTAALMSVDSHTPMAVCSNSQNIGRRMN